jgi:hypothetical protein
MLKQAVQAWLLAPEVDRDYLDRRIKAETSGTLDLAQFEELARHEGNQP